MKTNSAAKKRFDFTGTGKIKRKHAYHSHILTKKTTKQKRNLDYSALVAPADEAKVKKPSRKIASPFAKGRLPHGRKSCRKSSPAGAGKCKTKSVPAPKRVRKTHRWPFVKL